MAEAQRRLSAATARAEKQLICSPDLSLLLFNSPKSPAFFDAPLETFAQPGCVPGSLPASSIAARISEAIARWRHEMHWRHCAHHAAECWAYLTSASALRCWRRRSCLLDRAWSRLDAGRRHHRTRTLRDSLPHWAATAAARRRRHGALDTATRVWELRRQRFITASILHWRSSAQDAAARPDVRSVAVERWMRAARRHALGRWRSLPPCRGIKMKKAKTVAFHCRASRCCAFNCWQERVGSTAGVASTQLSLSQELDRRVAIASADHFAHRSALRLGLTAVAASSASAARRAAFAEVSDLARAAGAHFCTRRALFRIRDASRMRRSGAEAARRGDALLAYAALVRWTRKSVESRLVLTFIGQVSALQRKAGLHRWRRRLTEGRLFSTQIGLALGRHRKAVLHHWRSRCMEGRLSITRIGCAHMMKRKAGLHRWRRRCMERRISSARIELAPPLQCKACLHHWRRRSMERVIFSSWIGLAPALQRKPGLHRWRRHALARRSRALASVRRRMV